LSQFETELQKISNSKRTNVPVRPTVTEDDIGDGGILQRDVIHILW